MALLAYKWYSYYLKFLFVHLFPSISLRIPKYCGVMGLHSTDS